MLGFQGSVLGWVILVANLVLPAFIMRSGWRALFIDKGGIVPLLWWPLHLAVTFLAICRQLVPVLTPQLTAAGLESGTISTAFAALGWLTTLVELGAYGSNLCLIPPPWRYHPAGTT